MSDTKPTWIVATRNPRTRRIVIMHEGKRDDDFDEIAEYPTEEAARQAAERTTVCRAWGYETLEVT